MLLLYSMRYYMAVIDIYQICYQHWLSSKYIAYWLDNIYWFRTSLASNPKQYFIKVVQFDMLFENVIEKVKVMLSFGHKEVILSLFKRNIVSKNLFYKSLSVWYTTWKYGIKSESLAVIWSQSSHFVTF